LNKARAEQKELEAKLGVTPKTLASLPDDVFGGLDYYRKQVEKMADPSGSRAVDVEKRAILENLLGEIQVTPYADTRELELELELGIGATALPNVLPSGKADAYIVVAGAGFRPPRFALRLLLPLIATLPRRCGCG